MVSIKNYARDSGVTYEAVRQQIKRYAADLEGHIHKQGRTQYLDDEAVAILDSHRAKAPMVMYDAGTDPRVLELMDEVAELKAELKERDQKIDGQREKILELTQWKADQAVAIAAADQTQKQLQASNAENQQLRTQLAEGEVARKEEREKAAAELQATRREAELKAEELQTKIEAESARADAAEEAQKVTQAKLDALQNRTTWQKLKDLFKNPS